MTSSTKTISGPSTYDVQPTCPKPLEPITRLIFLLFAISLTVACSAGSESLLEDDLEATETSEGNDDTQTDEEDSDNPLVALNLPETPYNYANIELPEYYLEDQFPDTFRFTRPVTFFDNTPEENPVTDEGATLGRVLFYDKTLSANGSTACASCHIQAFGFSDPDVLSLGFEGRAKDTLDGSELRTGRHSMGLANARFYYPKKFFWDERADTLEDQVLIPFQDEVEMGLSLEQLEQLVQDQSYYPPLFEAAFGEDYEISSETIALALAQFVRSMVSVTSKYDKARVDVDSPTDDFPDFTASENAGKTLFFEGKRVENAPNPGGVVNCQGCHTTEAFIASVPDDDVQLSQIDTGVTSATNIGLDAMSLTDFGVGETTGLTTDNGKFKVPSLKNIALSAPYMHDGRFATLEAVVDHYSRGIRAHDNLSPPLLGGDGINPIRFNFTNQEKADLVAFLNTLTDEDMMTDVKFSDPFE